MEFGQQYGAVVVVFCLLGGTLWWLRHRGYAGVSASRGGGRRLEAIERLPLAPQHTLHLVRVGQVLALVSTSPSGCALLQVVPDDGGAR